MSDCKPYQIEAVNRAITDHDYPQLTCFDHDGICCPCGEFHDKTHEEWATHRAEAVLAAAGVTQSEPERRATIQQRVHLFKAGAWEPAPNQEGEQP